jgi:TetR/AcrR family transcriptional repressor of nem operon
MAPVETQSPDPIERIFILLEQYRQWLAPSGFAMGCPIGNLALELSDGHPEIRSLVHRNFSGWTESVRSWLVAAGDRLPARTERDQLAQLILTVMEGGIMQSRASGSPVPYDGSVAQLRSYFDLLQAEAHAMNNQTSIHDRVRPAHPGALEAQP